jgi:hypothetical protein
MAIRYHIAQFWDPRHHDDSRTNGIQAIARVTGVPYEILDTQSWDEHNLLWQLHVAKNDAMARTLAVNPGLMKTNKEVRNALLKSAIWRIHEDERLQSLTEIHPLVIEDTLRKIKREPEAWHQQWQQEMQSLNEASLIEAS